MEQEPPDPDELFDRMMDDLPARVRKKILSELKEAELTDEQRALREQYEEEQEHELDDYLSDLPRPEYNPPPPTPYQPRPVARGAPQSRVEVLPRSRYASLILRALWAVLVLPVAAIVTVTVPPLGVFLLWVGGKPLASEVARMVERINHNKAVDEFNRNR